MHNKKLVCMSNIFFIGSSIATDFRFWNLLRNSSLCNMFPPFLYIDLKPRSLHRQFVTRRSLIELESCRSSVHVPSPQIVSNHNFLLRLSRPLVVDSIFCAPNFHKNSLNKDIKIQRLTSHVEARKQFDSRRRRNPRYFKSLQRHSQSQASDFPVIGCGAILPNEFWPEA